MGISTQAIAVQALSRALNLDAVSTQLPPAQYRPDQFIVLSRIGGGSDDWATKNPRFLVECYAPDELAAEMLADDAWEAWRRLRTPPIHTASVDNNLAPYDNPDVDHVRFQFTAGLQLLR